MENILAKIKSFNTDMKGLPRKFMIIALTLLGLYIAKLIFPFVSPFVIAFLVSLLLEPAVKFFAGLFKKGKKAARYTFSTIFVLLFYGVLALITVLIAGRIIEIARTLIPMVGPFITSVINKLTAYVSEISTWDLPIPEETVQIIVETVNTRLSEISSVAINWAGNQLVPIAKFTIAKALSLPEVILYIVLTIMGTFYFLADRERIFNAVKKLAPDKIKHGTGLVKDGVIRSIGGYVRSALIMFVLVSIELSIGFAIMGLGYPIFWAIFIAFMDMLPVIGAGLFLIPIAIYGFVFGHLNLGIGGLIIYLITIAFRQVVEPKVIGTQMGLHPLLTMICMFAGYVAIGVAGMLIGPMIALLCSVFLLNDEKQNKQNTQEATTK